MQAPTLDSIEFNFNDYDLGLERYVRGIWELQMLRLHVLDEQLDSSLVDEINRINESLGISVISIDLVELTDLYAESEELKEAIEQSEHPKWLWLHGVDVLKDTHFAGWLRSLLTVRSVENVRVVFVARSQEELSAVFRDIKTPLYQSTIALDASFEQSQQ
ncbi:hypothetical protein OA7_0011150 [Vibrio cyclitrophicus 1F53]|uniref:hypothetical protein n=1 Tax=Vibrio cyclitrophicus TaxID=47951 RepID=UPI0002EE71FE|nr:hypothetical protein [Vibrio cyclitrophicus]OEF34831.1 hypothetical protein OA7_10805 [Vibrio cyclitrophicus 1F53]OEF63224.1 hypothetical protein OAA_15260 [Vibrio cyclitrophicus 1F175]PMH30361.1 hypothetical protein BCU72_01735 [Vibrio cyclitrophicus]PMH92223.1 hypothetical protein BCU60_23280 [Vibrio cyclitrophicus]